MCYEWCVTLMRHSTHVGVKPANNFVAPTSGKARPGHALSNTLVSVWYCAVHNLVRANYHSQLDTPINAIKSATITCYVKAIRIIIE